MMELPQSYIKYKCYGDVDSLAAVVAEYIPLVAWTAQRLCKGDVALVPDCIGVGNLYMLRAIDSWNPGHEVKLGTWIVEIISYEMRRQILFLRHPYRAWKEVKAEYVEESVQSMLALHMLPQYNIDNQALETELLIEQMRNLLYGLPLIQAVTLHLYLQGKSYTEIGTVMGITRQAVQQNFNRAVRSLRRKMDITES